MTINSAQEESNRLMDDSRLDQRPAENPYASTSNFEPGGISSSVVEVSPAGLAKTLSVWSVVCALSAAPSFIIAVQSMAKDQVMAMVFGVVVFIMIYSAADLFTRERPFRKDSRMRTILRSTFIVRSVMVIIFPIATTTDIFLGILSVSLVQSIARVIEVSNPNFDSNMSFGVTLVTTLVQGCLLSVLLFFLGLFIGGIIFATRALMNRV